MLRSGYLSCRSAGWARWHADVVARCGGAMSSVPLVVGSVAGDQRANRCRHMAIISAG